MNLAYFSAFILQGQIGNRREKMLVLSRKKDEKILIKFSGSEEEVEIAVVQIDQGRIRLGFTAPPSIIILRKELVTDQEIPKN